MMMLKAPRFVDRTGCFPERNIDTVFYQLNEALAQIRGRMGEERFLELKNMSDQMRALFDADPEGRTGDCQKGRELIDEMEVLLKLRPRRT
jgi:hypothetical protein